MDWAGAFVHRKGSTTFDNGIDGVATTTQLGTTVLNAARGRRSGPGDATYWQKESLHEQEFRQRLQLHCLGEGNPKWTDTSRSTVLLLVSLWSVGRNQEAACSWPSSCVRVCVLACVCAQLLTWKENAGQTRRVADTVNKELLSFYNLENHSAQDCCAQFTFPRHFLQRNIYTETEFDVITALT